MLTRSAMSHSHVLYIPCISTRMVFAATLKDDILSYAKRANQEWGEIMGQEPYVSLANEAPTWLDKVAMVEDVATTVMPVAPRAIEDARL